MKSKRSKGLVVLVCCLAFCFLNFSSLGCAADNSSSQQQVKAQQSTFGRNPVQKLARGLFCIISSVLLVPRDIVQVGGATEPFYMCSLKGPVVGGAQGVYDMLLQMGSGIFDVVTFPIPAGRDWEPLIPREKLFPEV